MDNRRLLLLLVGCTTIMMVFGTGCNPPAKDNPPVLTKKFPGQGATPAGDPNAQKPGGN
jgi:hypothetical protein